MHGDGFGMVEFVGNSQNGALAASLPLTGWVPGAGGSRPSTEILLLWHIELI
jgi:hypothetical protein